MLDYMSGRMFRIPPIFTTVFMMKERCFITSPLAMQISVVLIKSSCGIPGEPHPCGLYGFAVSIRPSYIFKGICINSCVYMYVYMDRLTV